MENGEKRGKKKGKERKEKGQKKQKISFFLHSTTLNKRK
jgi:hypothetical protein